MIEKKIDLSNKLASARHQGKRMSCLAFAASDLNQLENNHNADLSVEYLLHHASQKIVGWKPSDGLRIDAVLAALEGPGQPEEVLYPYQGDDSLSAHAPPTLAPLFTSSCRQFNLTVSAFEQSIASGKPVCIIVNVSDDFRKPVAGIVGDSPNYSPGIAHALLVVGVGIHNASTETYFFVRNSWGSAWGIDGHAWISATYLKNFLLFNFTI